MSDTGTSVRRKKRRSLLGFLTADLQSKMLALIFAALTWVWINREITDQVQFTLPVDVQCKASGVLVADVRPRRLRVVLVGPKETLFGLEQQELSRSIILTEEDRPLADGQMETTLGRRSEDFLKLPSGVTLKQQEQVQIRLVRSAQRSVRLKAKVVGQPAPGFVVERVELDPNQVAVQAPAELLNKLRELETEPIDVSGRTAADSPISTSVAIPRQVDGNPIEPLEGGRVRVKVFIARKIVPKQLRLEKRTVYFSAPASFPYRVVSITPAAVIVTVSGPPESEAEARKLRIFVELDSESATMLEKHFEDMIYALQVRGLPPGYKLIKIERRTGDTVSETEKVKVVMEKK